MSRTAKITLTSKNVRFTVLVFFSTLLLLCNCKSAFAEPLKKIVIDPGHGGYDSGTTYKDIVEKRITLDISKRLAHYLKQNGYKVILTRKKDTSLKMLSRSGNTRKKRDLDARLNIINCSQSALFISIHVNSNFSCKKANGSIVYYDSRGIRSKKLANSIQKSLNKSIASNYGRRSHKSAYADFYVLKKSEIPGVLIEVAFISNKTDRRLLTTDSFRNNIAKAIVEGIKKYELK